jgi:hypothetical protein
MEFIFGCDQFQYLFGRPNAAGRSELLEVLIERRFNLARLRRFTGSSRISS